MSGAVYDVGGVLYSQPFKIRRQGHLGFNLQDVRKARDFYARQLGFRVTDELTAADLPPDLAAKFAGNPDNALFVFLTHNADHHALLLAPRELGGMFAENPPPPDITLNQITWQVTTLEEVVRARDFFQENGVVVERTGRDMPGSNWHVYVQDPDCNTIELYYGMEQVGWDGLSKPKAMSYRGFEEAPGLPQMSELSELEDARARSIDVTSGFRRQDLGAGQYDVGGVLLPRPFRITRLGPMKLFVNDMARSEDFYTRLLGFKLTEEVIWRGHRCLFLRNGAEHHSLALFPKAIRSELGLSAHSACASVGLELANYRQLRDAVAYFRTEGATFVDLPGELSPGVDYCAHVLDPEGHCVQLYYYMEQIGWDGAPRPAHLRRKTTSPWPETLEPFSDTYSDDSFQGPLG